jgi:hypothetical protein
MAAACQQAAVFAAGAKGEPAVEASIGPRSGGEHRNRRMSIIIAAAVRVP